MSVGGMSLLESLYLLRLVELNWTHNSKTKTHNLGPTWTPLWCNYRREEIIGLQNIIVDQNTLKT